MHRLYKVVLRRGRMCARAKGDACYLREVPFFFCHARADLTKPRTYEFAS
jgi:hypothetical protein